MQFGKLRDSYGGALRGLRQP